MQPISNLTFGIWVVISIICDLVGIIPVVGDFTGPILMISLTTYLWKKGYGFVNVKRLAVAGIDTVIEMIPALQSIPVNLIAGTVVILAMAKIQAKTGLSMMGEGVGPKNLNVNGMRQSEKVIAERMRNEAKIPANSGGMRAPRIEDMDETLSA